MTTFVSGATGRVGGHLARRLIERGEEVVTLSLPSDPNLAATEAAGVKCEIGNLTSAEDVRRAMKSATSVYHMAAVISFQPTARDLLWDVNVIGTRNVFEAAAERAADHPVRLVMASSDQVYPTRFARYRPTDENHPREPYSWYGLTKVICEDMAGFFNRNVKGLDVSTAVFSHTEAPNELIDPNGEYSGPAFYVNARVKSLRASATHHAGANSRADLEDVIDLLTPLMADDEPLLLSYDQNGQPHSQELIDVRDIVDGLLLIHDNPAAIGETFNLAPSCPVSLAEFIPYLANATGRRVVEARIPIELGRTHGSNAKARAMLGFAPKYSLFDMVNEAVRTA
jgi:UDP-glucose 4-epimerase